MPLGFHPTPINNAVHSHSTVMALVKGECHLGKESDEAEEARTGQEEAGGCRFLSGERKGKGVDM